MRIGVCTTDFETAMPADSLFALVKELGFSSVQLAFSSVSECNFSVSDHIEIPGSVSDEAIAAIRAAAAKYDIHICAVNGTFNMAHPDPAVRAEGVARFEGFLKAVAAIGCNMATLCSGSRSLSGLWTYDPATADESAYADMKAGMGEVVAIAEKYNITLAIETEASNVVSTPECARRIMDEIGSPNLKMILDCANLFHRGEAHPENVRPAIDKAIEYFGKDIVIAHGKDIRESDGIDFCGTGFGIVNFPYMLEKLAESGFSGDMMLHGIYKISDMPSCLGFMRDCFAKTGTIETK
jgi:sugar phosphate isomerase/epimerase